MKKDWTYKKFEDCVENVKYTTKIQSKDYKASGEYPIISQEEELVSGYWNKNEDVFSAPRPLVVFGDHTRVLKYIDFDFVLGADGVKILLPIEDLEAKFLYYFLKWYNVPNLGYSRHYKLLKEISIPIPPLSIQRSIVSELDLLHSLIEKKQEQLRALDNLAQSLFYQMFGDPITNPMGWEKVPISVHVADKKTIKRASKRFAGSDEIEYIDISSINNQSHVITDTTNYIFNEAPSRAQQCVAYGDILISLVRPNLKNIAVVCDNRENLVASSGFCVLRVKETACLLFLKQILLSDYFTQYLLTRVSGANYPAVHESDILDYQIITPPLSLQQSFAAKVSAIEAQKQFISQSIKDVESLLAQRMDQYFSSLPVSVLPPVVHDGSK